MPKILKLERSDEIISIMCQYLNGNKTILVDSALEKVRDYALNVLCYDSSFFSKRKYDEVTKKLDLYMLCDGKMKLFDYDKAKNECSFYFENVTCYSSETDIDNDKNVVENKDIKLHFTGVQDLHFDGTLDTNMIHCNRIVEYENYVTDNGIHQFAFLGLIGPERFIIRINYEDVEAIESN